MWLLLNEWRIKRDATGSHWYPAEVYVNMDKVIYMTPYYEQDRRGTTLILTGELTLLGQYPEENGSPNGKINVQQDLAKIIKMIG